MKGQANPFVISGYEGAKYFCDRVVPYPLPVWFSRPSEVCWKKIILRYSTAFILFTICF